MQADDRPYPFRHGTLFAALAAVLFGATTPLIQHAGRGAGAMPTAAWLYAGAALASIGRRPSSQHREAPVRADRLPRLLLIGVVGALVAPACFAWGLQHTGGATASLLLNFEAVFTVGLGWVWFREPVGRRVGLALLLMVLGGACLLQTARAEGLGWGAVAVLLATLAWALDNALTRPLADLDPTEVVRWKGVIGATIAFALSLVFHQTFPGPRGTLLLLLGGATGFGLSLRLYLRAQRAIGAGRTASIFAIAPFVGAGVAAAAGDQTVGPFMLVPAALFGIGVYLHATEAHGHLHEHERVEHDHAHRHDDGHHHHAHDPPFTGEHSHPHEHHAEAHEHPHAPDVHHQHRH